MQIKLDVSLPELAPKVKDDYILAYSILEASSIIEYRPLSNQISTWIKSCCLQPHRIDQYTNRTPEIPPEFTKFNERNIIRLIREQVTNPIKALGRRQFSQAFDPISEPEKSTLYSTGNLEASCFDRTMSLIVTDIAPYVRSIVAYEARLQEERTKLSNLISEGGMARKGKRMRTTRAALSALEGGNRKETRSERYFCPTLNARLVMRTGKLEWLDAVRALENEMESEKPIGLERTGISPVEKNGN